MTLLITTLIVAFVFGFLLFKIYHFLLMSILKHYNLELEQLKSYTVTPKMKMVDRAIEFSILAIIIWRFYH